MHKIRPQEHQQSDVISKWKKNPKNNALMRSHERKEKKNTEDVPYARKEDMTWRKHGRRTERGHGRLYFAAANFLFVSFLFK